MWLSTTKMGSYECFPGSRSSSLCKCMIAGLGFILVVTAGSFSPPSIIIFTSMLLILSTVFFTLFFSQNPKQFIPNYEEEEEGCSEAKVESEYLDEVTARVAELVVDKVEYKCLEEVVTESVTEQTANKEEGSATVSEEESIVDDDDHCITTSEDEEYVRANYVARSSLSSEDDGSISDEDTLIEIELPTGHYLSPKQHKLNFKQKPSWMELLSEANNELATEEDNLIEIDLSIGSIMCPRFEIEA